MENWAINSTLKNKFVLQADFPVLVLSETVLVIVLDGYSTRGDCGSCEPMLWIAIRNDGE